jgi:hypothetical protein
MEPVKTPRNKIREVASEEEKKEGLGSASNLMESKDETTNRVINFYSPLYLASIIVKEGVNQNEEVIKKYGELERSYDFNLNKSVNCSFSEL